MTGREHDIGVSFDFFGTLVVVETPDDPASAVATELEARGVAVPPDWEEAYRTPQIETPRGREVSLPRHVQAILERESVEREEGVEHGDEGVEHGDESVKHEDEGVEHEGEPDVVHESILAAFESPVRTREGAIDAVHAMAERGPVGILSNCSVPGLVERSLEDTEIDESAFDAVVTSVACGWRKPDERAFERIATRLGTPLSNLVHVGDDPETDGGATDAGGRTVLVEDVPLTELPGFIWENGGNW